jgi:RimJ/RimL family protein N-acetyltransferase
VDIFKTKRLLLREASIDDSEFILKLVNEPAWHEFIFNHSIDTIEKASEYIEQRMIAMYQNFGFGLWVVEKRDDAVPIGICGLLKRDSLNCIDLGFAFSAEYWKQGFASEASIAALTYAKSELKIQRIVAITDSLNTRSVKLLERIGFVYESKFSHPGSDEVLSLYEKTQ